VSQALLGFERNLTHLDGHIVQLKRTGVTQPGFVQTIHGEGMPIYESTGYGDLYVEYNIVLPSKLSPDVRSSKFPCAMLPISHLLTSHKNWLKRSTGLRAMGQRTSYRQRFVP
jgi:DnaJ-class molecular chaperone